MHFYLLVGLILPWLLRAPSWIVAVALIATAWAWRFAVFELVPCDISGADIFKSCTYQRFFWTTKLPGTLDGFAIGILVTRVLLSPRASALVFRQRSLLAIALAVTALGAIALAVYWKHAELWPHLGMVVFYKTLLSFVFGLLLVLACGAGRSLVAGPLGTTNYFGTISYGIYLWHLIVLLLLMRYTDLSKLYILFYTVVITLAVSAASWHLLERPLLRMVGAGRHAALSPPGRRLPLGEAHQPAAE